MKKNKKKLNLIFNSIKLDLNNKNIQFIIKKKYFINFI